MTRNCGRESRISDAHGLRSAPLSGGFVGVSGEGEPGRAVGADPYLSGILAVCLWKVVGSARAHELIAFA
jgi:hypothetical protein